MEEDSWEFEDSDQFADGSDVGWFDISSLVSDAVQAEYTWKHHRSKLLTILGQNPGVESDVESDAKSDYLAND